MNPRFVKEEMNLVDQLHRDEELRLVVYDDATGKPIVKGTTVKGNPTIGFGRCLSTRGITRDEADYLFANDIAQARMDLGRALPWTSNLDEARLAVLVNMVFNMGIGNAEKGTGLLGFRKALSLIQGGQYEAASAELLQSKWASQVGGRAQRLAAQLASGEWK